MDSAMVPVHAVPSGHSTEQALESGGTVAELSMASLAMIASTFTWLTPLELAACAHLANAGMHSELFALVGESHPCPISAATEPSAPEIATTAFALFILSLCVAGIHVPRWLPWHRLLCRLLTALCMHSLRMDGACTTMAFLLPTFGGKKECGAARKRTATMTPTSAQTLGTATETKAAMQNPENDPAMPATGSATFSDVATEHIAAGPETTMSMEAIITALGALPTGDARAVVLAAQLVLNGKQQDIRTLCKPWGVQLTAGKRHRPMETIKQELEMSLSKRAMELKAETGLAVGAADTEHPAREVRADDALSHAFRSSSPLAADSTATEQASAEFCLDEENSSQLLQSTASPSTAGHISELNELLQSIGTRADPRMDNYPNLFA